LTAKPVRLAILISGRGTNMVAIAEHKRRAPRNYEIALVASNVPEARGLVAARRLNLPVWAQSHEGQERETYDKRIHAELKSRKVELIALAGYMRLLSPWFVKKWEGRILNIHPSLLPLYKGLDTHGRALAAGDANAGASVHVVTDELDGGPVIAQARIRIRARDTAESLAARVLEEEHKLYPAAIEDYSAGLRAKGKKDG